MKLHAIALGSIMGLAMSSVWPATTPDLAAVVAGKLEVVRHWSDVPARVRGELVEKWKGGGIADPDEPFQATDVRMAGEPLPARRLVFAAKSARAWLVCYEKGGIAHSFLLAVVPLGGQGGGDVWVALLAQEVRDLEALRAAVRQHRYRRADFD